MHARFWGTRGSIPSPLGGRAVRLKITNAVRRALEFGLKAGDDVDRFVDSQLSFDQSQTFGGNTSCVEIFDGETAIVMDMGSGLREYGQWLLASAQSRSSKRIDILMSHLHWDHVQGFPFFAPAYIPGYEIHIWSGHSQAEAAIRSQHSPPGFPVDFSALGAKILFHGIEAGEYFEIGNFRIVARRQIHHGDSYGYRISDGGKDIVYATDIEHKSEKQSEVSECVEFFNKSDLVIFDSMFDWGETQSSRQDWGHSSNVVGVDLCLMARAKHLCLFHHDPNKTDENLQNVLERTIRYVNLAESDHALQVSSAYDGLVIAA